MISSAIPSEPKEGSHYDLPIALALMAALGAIPAEALSGYAVLGELSLDGTIAPVSGVLPAAMAANGDGLGLVCPAACGPEAAWASADMAILAPRSLIQIANHFAGRQLMGRPEPAIRAAGEALPDLIDIKGQGNARRALEVAAAGGHNLLIICRINPDRWINRAQRFDDVINYLPDLDRQISTLLFPTTSRSHDLKADVAAPARESRRRRIGEGLCGGLSASNGQPALS